MFPSDNKTAPVQLDSRIRISIEELDKIIADYINQRVQYFTQDMTKEVGDRGYEIQMKINVTFKMKDDVKRMDE